jgi:adenosylhomocysteine nucleosidase
MNKKIKILFVLIAMTMGLLIFDDCNGADINESKGIKTGIIGALAEEVSLLKQDMKISKITTISGMEFCEGKLDGKDVIVVQSGMGKVNAGICAQVLINTFGANRVINTGVAGSLDAKIDIGDIVVSIDAIEHDFDLTPLGYALGQVYNPGPIGFPADENMRKNVLIAAKECAPDIHVFEGRICTGDKFIASKEQKNAIVSKFGGLCCEMEGGAIAQVCYINKTPFVIIRAISDKADDSEEMSYEKFKNDAAARCAAIIKYMVIHYTDKNE